GLAEHADPPGLLVPAHDAVVGNIAPQEAARVAEIDRPLVEAAAGGDAFDAGERDAIFLEARIEHLDGGVRVAIARVPAGERPRADARRKSAGARGSQHLPSCALHWYPPRRDLAGSRSATILARRSRVRRVCAGGSDALSLLRLASSPPGPPPASHRDRTAAPRGVRTCRSRE